MLYATPKSDDPLAACRREHPKTDLDADQRRFSRISDKDLPHSRVYPANPRPIFFSPTGCYTGNGLVLRFLRCLKIEGM